MHPAKGPLGGQRLSRAWDELIPSAGGREDPLPRGAACRAMETARKRPSGPEPWKRQAPEPGEEDAADEEGRGRAREERPETSRRAGRPGGALVTMAGLDPEPAVPVWLTEDDLGCIICHGLLASPATLPCGHSFCLDCLKGLWVCAGAGRHRSCPTCRQGVAPRLQLRKNTLLQDLADKYSRAARQREAGPGPNSGSDSDSAPGAQAAPRAPRCAAPLPVGGGSAVRPGPPAPPAPHYPRLSPFPAFLLFITFQAKSGTRPWKGSEKYEEAGEKNDV